MSPQDISHLSVANQFRGLTAENSFRNISSEILEFNVISSNKEIEKNLKLKIQSANRTISVRKCTDFKQKHLNLLEGDPVAIVTQTEFLENGRAFEYSTCVHSYKYFEFKTVIFR